MTEPKPLTTVEGVERLHAAFGRVGAALLEGFAPYYERLGFGSTARGMRDSAERMRRRADDRDARADRLHEQAKP